MRWVAGLLVLAGTALGTAGCGDEPICDGDRLAVALAEAQSGDTVQVGSCRLFGAFIVPPGVTLAGQGRSLTTLASAGPWAVVQLSPGSPPAAVRDVTIETDANVGVLARYDGEAVVERVDVLAVRGIGVGAEGVTSLTLRDVRLIGPATEENEASFSPLATPEETATHGMVLANVGAAGLEDVTATGFVGFGALFVDSAVLWTRGGARANLGTGLMVHGGAATLEDLDLTHTLGETRLIPSYGAVFAAGATVETTRVNVSYGRNFGMLHDNVAARHVDLAANSNVEAGIWVQNCPSFELSGPDVSLRGNGLAGLVALESGAVTVEGGRFASTDLVPAVFGETGRVDIGAGIQVIRPHGPVTLRDVRLTQNAQVGLLIHLAGSATTDDITIEDVRVDGLPSQYGAICQGGTVDPDWDAGIERDEVTAANDAACNRPLDRAGVLQADNMPAAERVARDGLVGVIDPEPPP